MKFNLINEKFLKLLRAKLPVGGLEISDSILRWSSYKGGKWNLASLRLPPGLLVEGKITNIDEFSAALKALKKEMGAGKRATIPTIVSLSSLKIYTQIISIPALDSDKVDSALALNLQMSSPIPFDDVYAGTELIRRDEDAGKMEYLASFIEKDLVDDLLQALQMAGFLAVAVEPRSISLARLIRKMSVFEHTKGYIVMSVDSNGLEFLILRNGGLHFDYFNSWQDLADKQISLEGFKMIIVRNLNQVLNYYKSQWSDPIDSIMLSSVNLTEEIKKIVETHFPFKVQELQLNLGNGLNNEWAISMGAGLRGNVARRDDKEINLMGWSAREEYRREQVVWFFGFWSALIPAVMGMLIAVFVGGYIFLDKAEKDLKNQTALNISPQQTQEVQSLEDRVQKFNTSVNMLLALQKSYSPRMVDFLQEIRLVADANEIVINRLSYTAGSVTMTGEGKMNDDVVKFRKELEGSKSFANVDIPFTTIQQTPQGFSFSATFNFIPSNVR